MSKKTVMHNFKQITIIKQGNFADVASFILSYFTQFDV